jgi:hypothetical protein
MCVLLLLCSEVLTFKTCMRMHSSKTCRCTQSHTLDECRIMHVKHERATMDGICVNETQFSSYAAHDSEWLWSKYAEMQTFKTRTFFVNHSIWQALHKPTLPLTRRELCLSKPWNHTSTCRPFTNHESQLKHFAQCFMDSWSAHSSMTSRCVSISHRKSVNR